MPAPKNPPEFNILTSAFVVGSAEIYGSAEAMADAGWECLHKSQLDAAKAYLDELLSGKYTESELRNIWRASKAHVSPFRGAEGSCREFLELIRDRYDKFDRSFYSDAND